MKPILVILNPEASGLRKNPALLSRLRVFPALDEAEIVVASHPDQARKLAVTARQDGREIVAVAGGDGTVHDVVNGLLTDTTPDTIPPPQDLPAVAVIPLGTGNDLARSLGLSDDLRDVLRGMESAGTRTMDLIRVEGKGGEKARWCVNMVTGGAVGREGTTPEAEAKEAWGILAYARQGVETLEEGIPTYDLSLRLDDGEVLESRALNLILGNGRFTGGGLPVTPTAYLDDGLADLIVVPELDLSEMAVLTSLLLVGRHSDHESLHTRRVREVEMTSDPPLDLNLDGEPGRMAEARFEVVPGALRVVVGEEPDRAFEEPDAVEE